MATNFALTGASAPAAPTSAIADAVTGAKAAGHTGLRRHRGIASWIDLIAGPGPFWFRLLNWGQRRR